MAQSDEFPASGQPHAIVKAPDDADVNGIATEGLPANGRSNHSDVEKNTTNGESTHDSLAVDAAKKINLDGNTKQVHNDYAKASDTASVLGNGSSNGHRTRDDFANEPIAICGMGVRLPGDIRSPSALYQFLASKGDARTTVPTDRFNIDAYYDPSGKAGTIVSRHGYFLSDDFTKFDTEMFSMSNAEVAQLDPSQRLLLEVTREALETAGEADYRGKNIGSFIGDFTVDWEDLQNVDQLHCAPYQLMGKTDFVLANRISYEYDLVGPSLSVKTACSASGEALYQAVLAIRAGSCPAAIVGGANIILTPRASIGMTSMGVLSPDGNCKTFDAKANGYARGESVCALYVKRLSDAVRDGNPIRAVIRACDSNADGGDGTRSFGTPNPIAQEALIRRTYEAAGLSMSDTQVVECHGTGTPIGDPLEVRAVAKCFGGGEKVYIGSLKPNLGHSEGASAMASVIKAVVALENRTILPNIKFDDPNPGIHWDRNLEVPVDSIAWPAGVRERISINSFGLGGSNVHIIVDSAAAAGVESTGRESTPSTQSNGDARAAPGEVDCTRAVMPLTAASRPALERLANKCASYLKSYPSLRGPLLHTLATARERLRMASYCIVDGTTISSMAPALDSGNASRVAFVFTGQGAQWTGMGKEMLEGNLEFAKSIELMDQVISRLEHRPKWSLQQVLLGGDGADGVLATSACMHPACTAIQVAYVDALAARGIQPSAVVGHSSGEMAAAYAAGIITREEAITLAYYRGYACSENKTPGTMAAIGLGADEVEPFLQPGVVIACENSDISVTLSGDTKGVQATIASLSTACPDAFVRQLRVPMAYHSYHMQSSASLYNSLIAPHLAPKAPRVPFYSTVSGLRLDSAAAFGPDYWQHGIERRVRFRPAVVQMLSESGNDTVLLEIGPHSALAGPLRHIYKETGHTLPYASVAERGQDAMVNFLQCLGKLYVSGLAPRVSSANESTVLPDAPTYPWNHESSFWSETRVMAGWRFRKHHKHELLGQRALESSDVEPMWRNLIRLSEVGWLADHCVGRDIVFPAAGYIAMAGAAVAQLTESDSYTVSDVEIANAMLLTDDMATEVVTTLRKHKWTNTNESKWWAFAITSEHNGGWVTHCHGLVTQGCAIARPEPVATSYVRRVSSGRVSAAFARLGLNYGPRFTGLEDITASPIESVAALTITDRQIAEEGYALHPASIDLVLQSLSVASTHGQMRDLSTLYLPTFVEQLYVGANAGKSIKVHTTSLGLPGTMLGESYGIADGKVAFVMNGFRGSRIEGGPGDAAAGQSTMSFQWHPAIDFAPVQSLIRPARDATDDIKFVERYALMVAFEVSHEAAHITEHAQPYFKHYLDGINRQLSEIDRGLSAVPDAAAVKAMSREERRDFLETARASTVESPVSASIEALWRAYANIKEVLRGEKAWLDVLLVDDVLMKFYDESNSFSDVRDYFRVLGLNKPQLRVLEIGAGTGGTTAAVLDALHSSSGERLYGSYTITDISAGFVSRCKERFAHLDNLEYAVLDISADPQEQGFALESYDVVLGSNVLHATPKLVETLSRCCTLLKPDGKLFMQELSSDLKQVGLIMGLFEGWWLGIADNRPERPYIALAEWEQVLRQSGFAGIEAAVHDNETPDFFVNVNITARPRRMQSLAIGRKVVVLKRTDELDAFGLQLKGSLEAEGNAVLEHTWGQPGWPQGYDVVSLIDVSKQHAPILQDINEDDLATLLRLIDDTAENALIWLTRPAQIQCEDAHHGQVLGVARGIRAELAVDFVTLELDTLDKAASEAIVHLIRHTAEARAVASETDELQLESEFVWRGGQMLLGRAHASTVEEDLAESAPRYEAKHLVIGQRGMLQTMHWRGHPLPSLAANYVQLRVSAAGLNFHDVATAIGIIEAEHSESDGYHSLGFEGAAVVTAVGDGVKHVVVGDRVVIMDIHNAVFATEIQADAALCVKIPDNLSDLDAAGMVLPYVTVLWSLIEKARFRRGQSLLIHSAAGGVGIAAIHVARWLGAEIYCTVGAEAKIDFLVNTLAVPRDRIFHSRDDSFQGRVLQATGGKGVDAVLNSLSGELLHATWKCVAPFGCVLDLGKRDFTGRGRLAMYPFLHNRAYFGIDLAAVAVANVAELTPYYRQVIDLFEDGHISPLHPTTMFAASQIQDAFRYMQKGVHMGRIVIQMPEDSEDLPLTLPLPKPAFRHDAAYLIAGGIGGLGRSIVSWMVEHGAKHVVIVSPSAGTKEDHQEFRKEMHEAGAEVQYYAGDIGDVNLVRHVLSQCGRPIRGVLQLAMVLSDAGFLNMDLETWTTATDPKIKGTVNLHELLLGENLDFFVMTGSVSGSLGSYGQTNYAAGNAFLDAFVRYRRGLGLPAAVIDLDVVGDIGFVASSKEVSQRFARAASRFMTEGDFLRGLHLVIERSAKVHDNVAAPSVDRCVAFADREQIILHNEMARSLSDPQNTVPWRRDPRLSVFRNIQEGSKVSGGTTNEGLRSFLASLSTAPERLDLPETTSFLAQEIAKRICAFLMKEEAAVDTSQTLATMGADSLVAIEIRNWWRQTLGVEVSVLELSDPTTTMENLGALAVGRLRERFRSQ